MNTRFKKIIYFIIILLLLESWVLSVLSLTQINETTPKTINESKIINLNAQQLIINDKEVKETIGQEWKIKNTINLDYGSGNGIGIIYNNNNQYESYSVYDRSNLISGPIDISILTFSNIRTAKEYYNYEISIKEFKENGNQINIGDNGYASTVNEIIKVVFIRNNVISTIYLIPDKNESLTVDQAIQLAKKTRCKNRQNP